jgi:hypothetical protein
MLTKIALFKGSLPRISQRGFASSLPTRYAEKDYYNILGIETYSTPE